MTHPPAARAARARRLDEVCDRFEADLKAGPAAVDDYLPLVPEEDRPRLRDELAQLQAHYRRQPAAATPALPTPAGRTWPAAAPPSPAAPPRVPGYELLAELGRGGMGVVYKARHLALNRPVALKMVLAGAHASPDQLARFRAEAEAVARLQHPAIVTIHEVGDAAGLPYLALELLDGGSLDGRLRGTPLPAREAAALVEALARAAHFAHERGVVHRDLKPANVLLTAGGAPKLADFGLAKRLGDDGGSPAHATQTGAVVGTPSYMAPEQAGGQSKRVGPAADVYALGAILYECLTGRPPFKAETAVETLIQVQTDEPVPPTRLQPRLPRDLETISLKCLQKAPEKRYPSAAALADDLARFLAGEAISARPATRTEQVLRWARRHPALASALAVGALALAALTAGLTAGLMVVKKERDVARQERNNALLARARTRAALDEVSSEAIETLLTQQPELTDRHKAFLRRTLQLYAEFAASPDTDLATRAEVAWAHNRMANIRLTLGELDEARVAFTRAIELFTRLTADGPADPAHLAGLARTYDHLGGLHYQMQKRDAAEDCFQRAVDRYEALDRAHPDNPQYRIDHASARVHLANVIADRRDDPAAEAAYRQAIALLDSLPLDRAAAADPRPRLASARYNLALLLADMGQAAEAEKEYRRAVALNERLVHDFPRAPQYARQLSSCLINLSGVLAARQAGAEAEALHRRGLEIQEGLARDYPSVPEYRKFLGRTLHSLALLLKRQGQFADGRATYLRAIAVREALVRQYPHAPEYRRDLGSVFNNLAFLEMDDGRLAHAIAGFRRAIAVQGPLVRDHPGAAEYRTELGRSYGNLGTALLRRRDPRPAELAFRLALEQQQALLAQFPNDPVYLARQGASEGSLAEALSAQGQHKEALEWCDRSLDHLKTALGKRKSPSAQEQGWLVHNTANRATTLERLSRFPEALAAWDEVVKIAPAAERANWQMRRALSLALGQRLDEALAESARLTKAHKPTGPLLVAAARVHAQAGASSSQKRDHAALALALLRQAEQLGHFKARAEVERLSTDPHLQPLHERPEFQSWLAGLGPPTRR